MSANQCLLFTNIALNKDQSVALNKDQSVGNAAFPQSIGLLGKNSKDLNRTQRDSPFKKKTSCFPVFFCIMQGLRKGNRNSSDVNVLQILEIKGNIAPPLKAFK